VRSSLRRALLLGVTSAALVAMLPPAVAQPYPSKPIKFVVPWSPGGATDAIARIIAQPLSQELGVAVVIDNRAGAGGNIGTAAFVREPADGYVILMATSSTNAANPHLYKKLGFDPDKDFTPVVYVASVPNILVVPSSSPVHSVKELLELARKQPGKLTYGSAGVGASQHLAGAMFKNTAKIDILHVPYKGSGPAAVDLMAGHIDLMLDTGSLASIKGGKLRALAVASEKRLAVLPDVPTFKEAGLDGMIASAWYGVMAPAKTPPDVVAKLNQAINKALKMP
jgi:tripartite-type tricarboxylate transporter receptor subunit TctC